MQSILESLLHTALQLHQDEHYAEAEAQYHKILQLDSTHAPTHFLLGTLYFSLQRIEEALSHFLEAQSLTPTPPELFMHIGQCYFQQEKYALAIDFLQKALQQSFPTSNHAHYLLAYTYEKTGDYEKASSLFKELIALPSDPEIQTHQLWNRLGTCYLFQEKGNEAIQALEKAVEFHPSFFEAWLKLARTYFLLHEYDKADNAALRATEIKEQDAELEHVKGKIAFAKGKHEQALAHFQKALSYDATHVLSYHWMAQIYLYRLEFSQAEDVLHEAFCLDPSPERASAYLSTLNYNPQHQRQKIFQEHKKWGQQQASSKPQPPLRFPTHPRKKIGYLSPDFHATHPIALFMHPVLTKHDFDRYEIHCYYSGRSPEKNSCPTDHVHWHHTTSLTMNELKQQIQGDEIDILVDLSGHTAHNSLPLFSQRAAPVQVSYLGYPASTGLPTMDYRITDLWADPPEAESQAFYSEKLCYLPHGFLCFSPPTDIEAVQARPQGSRVCFGSFNNVCKMNDAVIQIWSEVLRASPDSQLILKSLRFCSIEMAQRVQSRFTEKGIDPERIHILPPSATYSEHLQHYHQIDIALDPFPYNGTTTTCEALWMGVPVLTLEGADHRSRVGVSILSQAGYKNWIAKTSEEYIQLATDLAQNAEFRKEQRRVQRTQLQGSSLCDSTSYVRELEDAYERMWKEQKARA